MERPGTICVVGGGVVGSIVTAHLARAGLDTLVVESGPRHAAIERDGVRIRGVQTLAGKPRAVLSSIAELAAEAENISACLLCTKAWALRHVLPQLKEQLRDHTVLVSVQNGIGPAAEVARVFPRPRVARAVVNFAGAVNPDDGSVTMHWFQPPNYVGVLDGEHPHVHELAETLTKTGLTTSLTSRPELKRMVFRKTMLNAVLNALCSTTGITMAQAMTWRHTRALAVTVLREAIAVAEGLGYHYGDTIEQECLEYLQAGQDHMPSMWYDLQSGNPTEIDYINGRIVELGATLENVDVRLNRLLTLLVVTREIACGARRPDDIAPHLVGDPAAPHGEEECY